MARLANGLVATTLCYRLVNALLSVLVNVPTIVTRPLLTLYVHGWLRDHVTVRLVATSVRRSQSCPVTVAPVLNDPPVTIGKWSVIIPVTY